MTSPIFQDSRAKEVFPVGNTGLNPVPAELAIADYLESRESVYLYNPFAPGMSVRSVPLSSLTYREIAQSYIVETPHIREINSKGRDGIERYNHLKQASQVFWDVFVSVTRRILSTPKRDQDRKMDITPDMGLVIQKPKRKIEGPKMVHRPGPPKPAGGR